MLMLTNASDPARFSDMELLHDLVRFCIPDSLINAQQIVDLDSAFDYQSECHCSKTKRLSRTGSPCLITSQNATAPKLAASSLVLVGFFCHFRPLFRPFRA